MDILFSVKSIEEAITKLHDLKQWHEIKSWQMPHDCEQRGVFSVKTGKSKVSDTKTEKLLDNKFR